MLINDSGLVLVEMSDLEGENSLPATIIEYLPQLRRIADWGRDYLSQPHPDLGRRGNVCPFVSPSMARERFYLSVYPGGPVDAEEALGALASYRDWYLDLAPRSETVAQITTILVLFPDLPASDLSRVIDRAQEMSKLDYVRQGLMIGEFHSGPPDKGGLWNPDFRPLRSPVPLLAIRHMVATDFPFLRDDRDTLIEYLRLFGDQVSAPLREPVKLARIEHGLLDEVSTS